MKGASESNEIINKISNFVEGIRIQSSSRKQTPDQRGSHKVRDEAARTLKEMGYDASPSTSAEQEAAKKVLIDAEQFKAKLQAPKGRSFDFDKFMQNLDDDDEFFHVTCHIESSIRTKIARGEFVDLDKLLPRDKTGSGEHQPSQEENRVELVQQGGHTYFKPVRENQINGLRRWEQAFRVYAAIYTEANPERSGEIWQYMHVINTAAAAYQWENVAAYDLTFRQLMAFKPHRSWAKIYNQGWNLSMKEPIGKSYTLNNYDQSTVKTQPQQRSGDWRDYCCWKYNKNRCNRGPTYHYDHRCTYCGGWNHGFFNCRRRLRKESGQDHQNQGKRSGGDRNCGKRQHSSPHK